jgi:hypothetical protein
MHQLETIQWLKHHFAKGALHRTQVYYWMTEMKPGRTDLATMVSPSPTPDARLALANKIEGDPFLSARTGACSMGIAASTVTHHLMNFLGMKYCH